MSNITTTMPEPTTTPRQRRLRPKRPTYDPGPLLDLAIQLTENRTDTEIAQAIGVSDRTLARWRAGHATMSEPTADKAACRIGLHLSLVYPEYWSFCPDGPA